MENMYLMHVAAVVIAGIALYFSAQAYTMFGQKTRKWFKFNVIGFAILTLTHLIESANMIFSLGIQGETLELIEHIIFYTAMASFAISYYTMTKEFKKRLEQAQ